MWGRSYGGEMLKRTFWIALALFAGATIGASGLYAYLTHIQHMAIPHTKETTDDALADYTLWLMVFTGILAVATIGLGVATVGLYLTGEKQVKVTLDALIGDQRAWIITELLIGDSGVEVDNMGPAVDVRLKVSNMGRTPAVAAHTNMRLVCDVADVREEVAKLATESRIMDHDSGLSVPPGGFYFRPWHPSAVASKRHIGLFVIGCVSYGILQDREVHQTAFAYQLGVADGSDWGLTISDSAIQLQPHTVTVSPWAGGFAT